MEKYQHRKFNILVNHKGKELSIRECKLVYLLCRGDTIKTASYKLEVTLLISLNNLSTLRSMFEAYTTPHLISILYKEGFIEQIESKLEFNQNNQLIVKS